MLQHCLQSPSRTIKVSVSFRNSVVSWPFHTNLNLDCKWFHPFSCIGIFTGSELVRQLIWLKNNLKIQFLFLVYFFELMYYGVIWAPEKRDEHIVWRKTRTVAARLDQLKLLWSCRIWCGIRMVQKLFFSTQLREWWSFKLQETKASCEWVHNYLCVCIWFGSTAIAKI